MIWILIFLGIILLLVYFWYVTIPIIILVVLWYFKDDIRKRKSKYQKKSEHRQSQTNQQIFGDSKYWNLTQKFNISESEAQKLFGYNFREYSTTKELYKKCMMMHKNKIELSSHSKYLILTLSLIFDEIYKSYIHEVFESKLYYVTISREKLETEAQNIQNSFRHVFENYEDLRLQYEELKAKQAKERQEKEKQERQQKAKERQEKQDKERQEKEKREKEKEEKSKQKSRKKYQKSEKTTQNDSKSEDSRKRQKNYSRNTIQQRRISERLEKFKISESDAEIIFGRTWKSILGKPEYLFFYDVWKLDIKITYDFGSFKTRLGSLYSKLLEIIRIVDEENPEQARGKKSQKSRSRSQYNEYNYGNNSNNFGGYDYFEDDEDDEDDEFEEDTYDDYNYDDSFNDDYEDQEKIGWAFSIFGLSRDATITEIKTRYRELSLKYHPDRNHSPDATVKMTEINNAYELLSNFVGAAS